MDIQEIMKTGAINELKHRINNCIRNVQSEHWQDYRVANGNFNKLGAVIEKCEKDLKNIRFLLEELQKLDKGNN